MLTWVLGEVIITDYPGAIASTAPNTLTLAFRATPLLHPACRRHPARRRYADAGRAADALADAGRIAGRVEDAGKAADALADAGRTLNRVDDTGRIAVRVNEAEKAADALTDARRTAGAGQTAEQTADALTDARRTAGAGQTAEQTADALTDARRTAGAGQTAEQTADAGQTLNRADDVGRNDPERRRGSGASLNDPIPQYARDVADYAVNHNGNSPPGYVGNRTFRNDGRNNGAVLPRTDSVGNPITYKEYDVHLYRRGVNRGAERVVIGSDGSKYYTNDHYRTFTKFE